MTIRDALIKIINENGVAGWGKWRRLVEYEWRDSMNDEWQPVWFFAGVGEDGTHEWAATTYRSEIGAEWAADAGKKFLKGEPLDEGELRWLWERGSMLYEMEKSDG